MPPMDSDDYEAVEEMVGDIMGADIMGAARPRRALSLPKRPKWRATRLAPGVQAPQEGQVPLPLTAQTNSGVYNAANTTIQWLGRTQKPFRAERLMFSNTLAGGAVGTVFCDGMFVGTDLQQGALAGFDLAFFAANAFDTRMKWLQAEPGVDITINTHFVGTIGAGTATVSLMIIGKYIQ